MVQGSRLCDSNADDMGSVLGFPHATGYGQNKTKLEQGMKIARWGRVRVVILNQVAVGGVSEEVIVLPE